MKVVKVAAANPLKTVSPRDEMLIKKMLELLKKYGCEFCDRRFDTKFALSHHERWVLEIYLKWLVFLFWWLDLVCSIPIHTLNRSHLKEHQKKVEQDPDFVRKKLKLNADGTPREKVSQ